MRRDFDGEAHVSDDDQEGNNKFTGKIRNVTIKFDDLNLGAAE